VQTIIILIITHAHASANTYQILSANQAISGVVSPALANANLLHVLQQVPTWCNYSTPKNAIASVLKTLKIHAQQLETNLPISVLCNVDAQSKLLSVLLINSGTQHLENVDVITLNVALTNISTMNCAIADVLIKYAHKIISSTMNNANATVLSLLELQHVVTMNSGQLKHANAYASLTLNVVILTQNFGQLIYADAHASLLLPVKTIITPGISNLANAAAAHQAFAVLNNTSIL